MTDCCATSYEAGRRRGLAECPCGANPGADDLLGYEDGIALGRRQGVWAALWACLGLLLATASLGRRR